MERNEKIKPIRFQLYLHYNCNYRCPYCYFLYGRKELNKNDIYHPVGEWIDYWDKIYDKYGSVEIHLTGGEPSIYPSFLELVKELSKQHYLMISTNLSTHFESFSEQINPERIKLGVGASFHPSHIDFASFLKNALILKNKGFWLFIVYVAYPPQFKQMSYYKDKFKAEGFNNFVILPFCGSYANKMYPESYSSEERKTMWQLCQEDNNLIENLKYQLSGEEPDKSISSDLKSPKGKLCRAGQRFAIVFSDGRTIRCGKSGESLGSFFGKNFQLLDDPLPCEQEQCFCEFDWLVEKEGEDSERREMTILKAKFPQIYEKLSPSKKEMLDVHKSLPPPYKIFFNWDIHYSCNYRCSYCFFYGKWEECSKGNTYPKLDELIKKWRHLYDLYGTCRIDFSGGEPSTYPNFIDLVDELSTNHLLRITTNLSFDVQSFADRIAPKIINKGSDRVMLNPSFHPEFESLDIFIKKLRILKQYGFTMSVTYVAYPPHLGTMVEAKKQIENTGANFVVQPFRGTYNGKKYPEAYTEEEKKFLKNIFNFESGVINYFVDNKIRKDKKLCRMGQMYGKIHPNGEVLRCCASGVERIGNLFDHDFKMFEEPRYCEVECPCWKAMCVEKETQWLPEWR